jgi:hypothetical protein
VNSRKYIGVDVHKESISIAVMSVTGKIVMECLHLRNTEISLPLA